MTGEILTRVYPNTEIDRREVLRYAGAAPDSKASAELLDSLIEDCRDLFTPRVCYTEFDVKKTESELDLGFTVTDSKALGKCLSGCDRIILFAGTVGGKIDRLMTKYAVTSAAKALLLQALGAERIEALADEFSKDIKEDALKRGYTVTPRFSPGYADLSLSLQRDIFRVLDCQRKIGLTLNESLLMSPTKSITAIIGLKRNENY